MIGADTNVLLRFFLADDEQQAGIARRLVEAATTQGERLFVNHIVLCELAWVAATAYSFSRAEVGELLEMVLASTFLAIPDEDQVWRALHLYRESSAGFADCLLGCTNEAAGCSRTATFDRKAARLPMFAAAQ